MIVKLVGNGVTRRPLRKLPLQALPRLTLLPASLQRFAL
jgi:hypothetical protein